MGLIKTIRRLLTGSEEPVEQRTRDIETVVEEVEESVSTMTTSVEVTEVSGIGPAYAERLAAAGITTAAELAAADAASLADRIDESEKRVAGWIEAAAELT
jgi:predicted flap endonuclease-1-like 5' DNA nuclease